MGGATGMGSRGARVCAAPGDPFSQAILEGRELP